MSMPMLVLKDTITLSRRRCDMKLQAPSSVRPELSADAALGGGCEDDGSPVAVTAIGRKKEKKARNSFLALHVSVDLQVDSRLERPGAEGGGLVVFLLVLVVLLVALSVLSVPLLPAELDREPESCREGGDAQGSVGGVGGQAERGHGGVSGSRVGAAWVWERLSAGRLG